MGRVVMGRTTVEMGAVWTILAIMFAVAGTVLAFIFLLPAKKRESLPPFLRKIADFFDFKELVLEKILKAFYILTTLFVVVYGVFTMLFSFHVLVEYEWFDMFLTAFFSGVLYATLGVVVVRLVYEGCMLLVLLVKNVMDINNKIKAAPVTEVKAETVVADKQAVKPMGDEHLRV